MSFIQELNKSRYSPNSGLYLDEKNKALVTPKNAKGIGGFVFDIPDRDEITLESDITDHYTEDNSFLNDHKVEKPIIIVLSGFVGELVYKPTEGELKAQEVTNKLSAVSGFLPEFTSGGTQLLNQAAQIVTGAITAVNQVIGRTKNIVSVLGGETQEETLQQKAFNTLEALWRSQDLMTCLTPWRYFENMVIRRISFRQDGDTEEITDITVELKEIRTATIKITDFDNDINPPRSDVQEGEVEEQGIIRGQSSDWRDKSFLKILSEVGQ
jgi:hypothetical protein